MTEQPPQPTRAPDPERAREPLLRDLLGEQLRAARRARGETLRVVARRASLSPQYLSEIERGRKEPSSELVAAVGAALGLTLLDLTLGAAARLGAARSASTSRGGYRLAA